MFEHFTLLQAGCDRSALELPQMSQDSDLSAYELVRLENIRKNNEFLASLGLLAPAAKVVPLKKVADAEIKEKKIRQKREVEDAVPAGKRRRSSRLSGQVVKLEELPDSDGEQPAPADETSFYERMPSVPPPSHP